MTVDIEEFKRYLTIDKNALDHEVMQHPELLFRVSEAYIDAVAMRDAKKEMLAMTDAHVDAEVREELAGEKVTEAIVKNQVQINPRHVEAWGAYAEAKLQADVLGALRDSFSTRGFMLRDLVQLHVSGYWENTSVTGQDPVYRRQRQRLAEARERRE